MLVLVDDADVVLELLVEEEDLLEVELLPPLLPRPPLDYTRLVSSKSSSKNIFSEWRIFIFDLTNNIY